MIHGQDWSSFQSASLPTAGLAFVFVKRTEGTGYVNPKATAQVAHARAGGLVVGHYHYPHIANSASTETDYFLRALGGDLHAGDILCLDWEWYGQKVSEEQARAYKAAFISRIRLRAPGHRVVLYSDVSNWTHVDTDSNCGDGLWIATGGRPAGQPGIQHPWTFHQYSTAGGIDHDVAQFADAAALRAWAAGKTTTPSKEANMPLSKDDALTVWETDGTIPAPTPPVAAKDYADNKSWRAGAALGGALQASREAAANTRALLAQVAALTAAVSALAKDGGITAEQVQAAAQAGAQAALAELGHTLTDSNPTT